MFLFEVPTSNPISLPPSSDSSAISSSPGGFWNDLGRFFVLLFNGQNFVDYLGFVGDLFMILLRALPFILPLFFVLRWVVKRSLTKHNNDYNRDTKALRVFKAVSNKTYVPTKRYFAWLWEFIIIGSFEEKDGRLVAKFRLPWLKIWLLIWLFNFNIFAVTLSGIATALYFYISFDFVALYNILYILFRLLVNGFTTLPLLVWILLVIFLVLRWLDRKRKRIGLQRLRRMERQNKMFIGGLSICTMLVGTMGKGKTTLATDMVLSTEAMFRNKAYEMMLEIDLKFPHFPYIVLENELKIEIEEGRVFNLASCAEWITRKEDEFIRTGNICDYEHKKYGLHYDDKKTMTYLFDALKDYVKLYFIYIVNSSLILSNHAIRTDNRKIDLGNMPLWDTDFFSREAKDMHHYSKHSHILDFDMLRLGKKLIENNKLANAFEFGVIAITEVGKERGNQFKDQEIKETIKQLRATIKDLERAKINCNSEKKELERLTTRATHLTDKFNDSLKLIRHKCTVASFPFARVFIDEQRPESLGADARDLCEIVHIREKSDVKLTMPLFFIGELIHAFIFPKFKGTYQEYRFNRGDNTLLMYLFKKLGAIVHRSYTRIYNRFGYHEQILVVEDSGNSAITKTYKYFVSTKKIYSDRFSTDAYADIFAQGLKKVKVGLDQIPEYAGEKATEQELLSQNSYFINEIVRNRDTDN